MSNKSMQATVETEDETDDLIDHDDKAHTPSGPPSVKEEANVSRTRNKDKLRNDHTASRSVSPSRELVDDSDSDDAAAAAAARLRRSSPSKRDPKRPKEPRDRDRERERAKAKRKSVTYEQPRPPTGRSKTTPNLNIHTAPSTSRRQPEQLAPSHIITPAGAAPRPRAYTAQTVPRPMGLHGSPGYGSPGGTISRPPRSNSRFYGQPNFVGSFPPPPPPPSLPPTLNAPLPYPPHPPHSPMYYSPVTASPFAGPYPPVQAFAPAPGYGPPQPDYFGQGPPHPMPIRPADYRRPLSAAGHRQPSTYANHYEDDREIGASPLRSPMVKRRSSMRQQQEEGEHKLMPPPPFRQRRPSTTAAAHSPFPPPRLNRQSVGSIRSFGVHESDDDSQYSPSEQSRSEWRPHAVMRPTFRDSYESENQSRYERSPERRKRGSHYGVRAQSAEREYEEKMQRAQRYQEQVDGPTNSLTDTLLRIGRTPSQRTKSTGSRGGNDAHALTNRNSIDTEDMRILVKGAATLTIGDASMNVQDGAEIRIPTNLGGGGGTSRGGGSNASDVTYDDRRPEDRRTRVDRPQARGADRATSRAGSHHRGLPQQASAGYYAPPTEYSGYGDGYRWPQHSPMYAPPSGLHYPTR
ncbi:unnamed protein product [Discula destructiva]